MLSPLIAPIVAALVLALGAGALAVQRARQRQLVGSVVLRAAAATGTGRVPDILYFTGENCTICHVAQRPALQRLRELVEDVAIREIDVALDRTSARAYRVMTLPTTVVLDPSGRATAVNAGFAAESILRDQVVAARATSAQPVPA